MYEVILPKYLKHESSRIEEVFKSSCDQDQENSQEIKNFLRQNQVKEKIHAYRVEGVTAYLYFFFDTTNLHQFNENAAYTDLMEFADLEVQVQKNISRSAVLFVNKVLIVKQLQPQSSNEHYKLQQMLKKNGQHRDSNIIFQGHGSTKLEDYSVFNKLAFLPKEKRVSVHFINDFALISPILKLNPYNPKKNTKPTLLRDSFVTRCRQYHRSLR